MSIVKTGDSPQVILARDAVTKLRDFARAHGMDHRERDPLVMAIHHALDEKSAAALPQAPDAKWQPIETAPKDGTKIDLWAKAWLPAFDRFEFMRFADCWWWNGDSMSNSDAKWMELHRDWHATHWMPLPSPPRAALLPGAQEGKP